MASKKSSSKPSTREGSSSQSSSKAQDSSKSQDATKTPSEASKSSKIDHRRPAVMPGDLAGAEYNPARTEEGERVAQTGMNPRASRAGLLAHLPSLVAEAGGDPQALTSDIAVVDGSRAQLNISGTTDQKGVLAIVKQLKAAAQEIT